MQDIETNSLWPHVTGICFDGPSKGQRLTLWPSMVTTYSEFKSLYPNGKLLKKPELGTAGSHYDEYFGNRDRLGIFGREDNYTALDGKDLIFGINERGFQTAIWENAFAASGSVWVAKGETKAIATFDAATKTAAAFSFADYPDANENSVRVKNGTIVWNDLAWNSATGKSIGGAADDLPRIALVTGYWFAWKSFFPNTELIK